MNPFRFNRRVSALEAVVSRLESNATVVGDALRAIGAYIESQPTNQERREEVETMVQNYLNDSDWNTGQDRGTVTIPIHGLYTGGNGIPDAITSIGEYSALFAGTDYGPKVVRMFNKNSTYTADSDTTVARMRHGWDSDEAIPGLQHTLSFTDIGAGADAAIAAGTYDDFIDFTGDTAAQMVSEGAGPIILVPFNEVVGTQTLSGAVSTPVGTDFKAAFERIVTRMRAKVTIDHVILHLNSVNTQVMDEYIPNPDYWDSYAITLYEADGRGADHTLINSAWSYLQINHPTKVMSNPEWKTGDTSVENFSIWDELQSVFDIDVPFYIHTWANRDGVKAGAPLFYPEMRWEKAEANAKAKWINEWKKMEDLR